MPDSPHPILATNDDPAVRRRVGYPLAQACADVYLPAADLAVFALTPLGGPRCVAPLLDRLTRPRLGFALDSHHGGGWWTRPPGILDVLSGVPQYATQLLPAVRDASTDGIAVVRQLTEHGRVWPPTIRAMGTLGEIGPPAADALPVLRLAVAGDRRPVDPGKWDSIARDDELQHGDAVALLEITER